MKDFFFGDIEYCLETNKGLPLEKLKDISARVGAGYFTGQLNRLLNKVGGKISAPYQCSSGDLNCLLDKLVVGEIGLVELTVNIDLIAKSKKTLSCSIFLENGVIEVLSQWDMNEDVKVYELISTVLVPLHLNELETKTFIRWNSDRVQTLVFKDDYQQEVEDMLILMGKPYLRELDEEENMVHYVEYLSCASKVGATGRRGKAALTDYHQCLRQGS